MDIGPVYILLKKFDIFDIADDDDVPLSTILRTKICPGYPFDRWLPINEICDDKLFVERDLFLSNNDIINNKHNPAKTNPINAL